MKEQVNNEIDLMTLFIKLFRFIKKNMLFLVILFILGGVLCFAKQMFAKKYYESDAVGLVFNVSTPIVLDLINSVDNYIIDNNVQVLSQKLNISTNAASNIKCIKADTIEGNRFRLTVQIYDNNILDSLKHGFVNYINTNEYIKKRVDLKLSQNNLMINKIENQIESLKKLQIQYIGKSNLTNNITTDKTVILNENNISISLTNKILELYSRIEELKRNNVLYTDSFQVVEDFVPFKTYKHLDLKIILLWAFISLILGVLIAVVLRINNKIF